MAKRTERQVSAVIAWLVTLVFRVIGHVVASVSGFLSSAGKAREADPRSCQELAESASPGAERAEIKSASTWQERAAAVGGLVDSGQKREHKPAALTISVGRSEKWRSDPATQRQLDYIAELGGRPPPRGTTKGEASDLITSLQPAGDEHTAILKFFKVSTRGITNAQAVNAVESLMADEANRSLWANRPPNAVTKEFFRFIGRRLPSGVGHTDAEALKLQQLDLLKDAGDSRLGDWVTYERIIEEVMDPDVREFHEIKKPTMSLIRDTVAELISEGATYDSLLEDPDLVVERMVDKKPDLER